METMAHGFAAGFLAAAAFSSGMGLQAAAVHAGTLLISWKIARWLRETYEDTLDGEPGGDGPYLIGIRRTARVDVYS